MYTNLSGCIQQMSTTKRTKLDLNELKESLKTKNNGSVGVRLNKKIYEALIEYCRPREMARFIGTAIIEKLEREQNQKGR